MCLGLVNDVIGKYVIDDLAIITGIWNEVILFLENI